jgi:hypothetical protein
MNSQDDDIGSATNAQGDRIRQTLIALGRRRQEKPIDDLFREIQGYSNGTLSPADGESAAELLKSALAKADAILKPATAIPTAPPEAEYASTKQNPETAFDGSYAFLKANGYDASLRAADKLEGAQLIKALGTLSENLPQGWNDYSAHENLRRLAFAKLNGLDLISAFKVLSKSNPEGRGQVGRISQGDYNRVRGEADGISNQSPGVVRDAVKYLSELIPALGPEGQKSSEVARAMVGSHADLRKMARDKLDGEDLTSALCSLAEHFPHGLGKEKGEALDHIRSIAKEPAKRLSNGQRARIMNAIAYRDPPAVSISGPSKLKRMWNPEAHERDRYERGR